MPRLLFFLEATIISVLQFNSDSNGLLRTITVCTKFSKSCSISALNTAPNVDFQCKVDNRTITMLRHTLLRPLFKKKLMSEMLIFVSTVKKDSRLYNCNIDTDNRKLDRYVIS